MQLADGRTQLSNIQANEFWCNSHRICFSISSKSIPAVYESQNLPLYFKQTNKFVTVTELDFVFDNKTGRGHLKKY